MLLFNQASAGYEGELFLKNITFQLEQGQNLCVIGPNGSGKTTLLNVASGLIPYEGSVQCGEPLREVSTLSRSALALHLSLMTQTNATAFPYTVYETVIQGRYRFSQRGLFANWSQEDHEAVDATLDQLDLTSLSTRPISQLSGGQVQRVLFARALVQDAEMILLDEPTNHLDLRYQNQLVQSLKQWSLDNGRSVVGVFHDINHAIELADQMVLLSEGEIVAFGSSQQVLTRSLLKQVYKMDVVDYMLRSYERWQQLATS